MINFATAVAVVVTMVVGTAAASSLALAGADSPFYPDHLKNPNLPYPSVGVGSGIPPQYRLGN